MAGQVRRITASRRGSINRLAEILYDFLPLTSWSKNTVTISSIFTESSIARYLKGPKTKRQQLIQGFERVFRQHPRLPYTLVRKIVPASIEYRKHNRDPLTREELDNLSSCLYELGIDMRQELAKVKLDVSLPKITVPPAKLIELLR